MLLTGIYVLARAYAFKLDQCDARTLTTRLSSFLLLHLSRRPYSRSGIMVGKNSPRLFPLISGRLIVACLVAKFYASASALCLVDDGGVGMDGHY